jgi:hypothetical protein
MPTSVRSRRWVFTLNNYAEQERLDLLNQTCKYCVIGKEVGENGTPHLQGYIYFVEHKSLRALKSLNNRAHWENAMGTAQENYAYCTKEGNFEERGVMPATQEEKGKKGLAAAKERWELAKKGKFEELPPEGIKTYEYIYQKYREKPAQTQILSNLWIYGQSGCGKSRWIRENYSPDQFYWKPMTKWWDGYNHEPIILLDDFDPNHAEYLTYHLKIWCDHYPFNAEIKGGQISNIRPQRIIVTSQYHPRECFINKKSGELDQQSFDAINRRFQIIDFVNDDVFRNTPIVHS